MAPIPLCVSFARKDEAKRAGARWNANQKLWVCDPALLATDAYTLLRPFVPRVHRPELKPPYIQPWMVPQPLWGRNLRALLSEEQWNVVRRAAYAVAGNRCRVCGGRGPKWPVEADEAWEYNDDALTHTLVGVVALCPDCHHVRHWGKTTQVDGREEEAFAHLMKINGWSRPTAEQAVDAALVQWHERSRRRWTSDYSWVTRMHGFAIDPAGLDRAETANRAYVAEAFRRDNAERGSTKVVQSNLPSVAVPMPRSPKLEKRSVLASLRSLLRHATGGKFG